MSTKTKQRHTKKSVTIDDEGLDLRVLSSKFVQDRDLKDPPARLFRELLRAMNLNAAELIELINDYIAWEVTGDDPVKLKEQRTTTRGNIRSGFFNSETMTFPKLLNGLSILKASGCRITIEVDFPNRESVTVSEKIKIHSAYDKTKESEESKD